VALEEGRWIPVAVPAPQAPLHLWFNPGM